MLSPGPLLSRFVLAFLGLMLAGCASLPPPVAAPKSLAFTDVAGTRLAQVAAQDAPPGGSGLSGFRLLPEGATAYEARIALIRRAQKSIDAQYYILQDDAVGLLFLRELRDAARRGVRVRLLVDDLYTAGKDALHAELAAQPNFELRLFNPMAVRSGPLGWRVALSIGDWHRINRRMHNKLFIADNTLAITGGRNIADEYFMRSDVANFIDMDVLAAGPVVPELSAAFDDYWNSPQVRPLASLVTLPPDNDDTRRRLDQRLARAGKAPQHRPVDVLGHTPVGRQIDEGRLGLIPGDARVLVDIPEKITYESADVSYEDSVTQRTVAALGGASQEVIMVSPYFIPGERGMAALSDGVARGVHTVVLTNSLDATDETLVYAGYSRYRLRMLRAGVHVYELGAQLTRRDKNLGEFGSSRGRLHAKVAMIDRKRMFIGSMNLDGRSARFNTEIGLLIDSPALAQEFGKLVPMRALGAYQLRLAPDGENIEWIENDEDGRETVIGSEPGGNFLGRLKDWLLLQLVPEDLL